VFFSTHILSDATMLCDRVAIIVQGKLRDVGPLGDLLSPAVRRVEVVWRAAEERRAALREHAGDHETTSEGEVMRTDREDVAQAFIAAVVAGGGEVLQVTPQRQTLEELFVQDAAGQASEGA
jgi:ABC-2 type transport system ATP-binding protein